ncbi:hypothetical protein [Microbacterium yannicii]|uniref:COG1470 family protein n=1 Tax=Microbacterium yannicii TaxID=671622 RepID=UPI0002E49861|nr:hypothetical protein [Microbacterium yannicii]
MATVDIEPASLAVTPGESYVLTLTITNDGDDVEAYHVAAVDDAAAHVTITPDTLLVRAGETASATATLTLEGAGRWPVGDIIVRFRVVPAGQPDEFLVVEAIAAIQSFSEVAAALTPDALEAFRSSTAEVTIANAGNADTYAEVSLSAVELELSIAQSHVALPPDSTESIGLRVGARSLLWRGAAEQHPFVVTVSPQGGQTISLDGTFTQKPLLPSWSRTAAIAVGAVVAVALLVWGVASFLPLGGVPVASTPSSTAGATPTPPTEPVVTVGLTVTSDEEVKGGDDFSVTLEPDVTEAPTDSLLSMAIDWPAGLVLTDSDCEHWLLPGTEKVLKGDPQPGDECVVTASGANPRATLNFSTPPAGFEEEETVTATATRLLTSAGGSIEELEIGQDSVFGEATVEVDLPPYAFWMEIEDLGPSESEDDVVVIIHHALDGGAANPLEFDVKLPGFVAGIEESHDQCGDRGPTNCFATVSSDAAEKRIPMRLDVDEGGGIGLLELTGTSLNDVAEGVDEQVRGTEGLLVSDYLFDVVMLLGFDPQPDGGETATAYIRVSGAELPSGVDAYSGGLWEKTLQLEWPDGLILAGEPEGCTLLPDNRCTLPWVEIGKDADITMQFTVENRFGGGSVTASGAGLRYDPTTAADKSDGRPRDPEDLSRFAHWIDSAGCSLDGQCE